jgi:hypothetical protein
VGALSKADFADLGDRSTMDSALHRREREGVIRRVIRGIYNSTHFFSRSISAERC